MRALTAIITFCLISCLGATKTHVSFWEAQKNSFKYYNKNEFVSDSVLQAEYKTFKMISHPLFDKICSNPVYLYSLQERDSNRIEFTVVKDQGELGLDILYLILDKKDSLISSQEITGLGGEAGYSFETSSRFVGKDTLLNVGSITLGYDFDKHQKMEKTKGDSTFSYLLIDKSGRITVQLIREVKELHFEDQ